MSDAAEDRRNDPAARLAAALVDAVLADFVAAPKGETTNPTNGQAAVARLRDKDPGGYLRVVASLLPKEPDQDGAPTLVDVLAALAESGRGDDPPLAGATGPVRHRGVRGDAGEVAGPSA